MRRFGGIPLYCRQRPSRPRYDRDVSPAVSQGDRGVVSLQVLELAREMGMLTMGTVGLSSELLRRGGIEADR